jgi:phage gp29-like protein
MKVLSMNRIEPGGHGGSIAELTRETATRDRSLDWLGFDALLPDPDPVLAAEGADLSALRGLLTDAHVWSCYQSRKSGTLSLEWELQPAGRGPSGPSDRALQLAGRVLESLDVGQAVSDMLDAVFYGFSPVEVVWGVRDGRWVPARLVGRPPDWFAFDRDGRLRFLSNQSPVEGETPVPGKFIVCRHQANYLNPYGQRLLSRCFWPVAFKKGGFKFWAVFAEKFGMPWVVGKVPRGTGQAERGRVLDSLQRMVQDAVAVINDDESLDFPEAKNKAQSGEVYLGLIDAANREISKAILGQTLTTEMGQSGSYAAAGVHLSVRRDLVDQDKRMVEGAFNQLLSWLTRLNFADAAPPVFRFFQEENLQKERAERDALLVRQGVRLSRDYYRRTYNLEPADIEAVGRQDVES